MLSFKTFKKILLISLVISVFLYPSFKVFAQSDEESSKEVKIFFFSSALCPHCAKEREFLNDLEKKYPEIEIFEYELIYHPENKEILNEFYEKYEVPDRNRGRVPVTFTPTKYFIGFNEQIGKEIENCIKECLLGTGQVAPSEIKIPFLGSIDISKMSLPVLTITLGALDGFNPCAMWVLLFLIALLINTQSRKKMWLIAGTFIAASGIIYFLILAAWLNLFLAISYVNLIRIIIGVFALGVGIRQIKNFILFQPKVCKVLGSGSKFERRLKEKAEKLVSSPIMFGTILGIIGLAFGVNLVEFFCSAGLPAIFTQILSLQELSPFSYYLYLLLYTFFFTLDDLLIFFLAVITLRKIGFTEKYNYWATLIGGLLMLILGILLIFKPHLLMFA